jgi:hypothetical protein
MEMKDTYTENYKASMKPNKSQINKKTSCIHSLEDLILLKCPYYPK